MIGARVVHALAYDDGVSGSERDGVGNGNAGEGGSVLDGLGGAVGARHLDLVSVEFFLLSWFVGVAKVIVNLRVVSEGEEEAKKAAIRWEDLDLLMLYPICMAIHCLGGFVRPCS